MSGPPDPGANTLKGIGTKQVEEQGTQPPVRGHSHVPLVAFFASVVYKPLASRGLV